LQDTKSVIENLLNSEEPSIRWKIRVQVLGEDPSSESIQKLQAEIRQSLLVGRLLQHRDERGKLSHTRVYGKWQGAHWTMATLADIGYPSGDKMLEPIRDQLLDQWLGETFYKEFTAESKAVVYGQPGVPIMQGRFRRCASQQSNALWSILKLGLVNEKSHYLVERLLHWQWPDGGWNCDKNPSAHHSSFMESILPLRALALYGFTMQNEEAIEASKRAAEVFLKRHLYLKQNTNDPIKTGFTELHYPLYWHYDILHALKVMAEVGFISDDRCRSAIDLLASKQLPDGGWPAEQKYYKAADELKLGNDSINWGGTSKRKMNDWVSADALFVLKSSNRI